MYMVWHVDKYKITFKLVISHWTNEILYHTVVFSGLSRPCIIDARALYRAAARRLRNTGLWAVSKTLVTFVHISEIQYRLMNLISALTENYFAILILANFEILVVAAMSEIMSRNTHTKLYAAALPQIASTILKKLIKILNSVTLTRNLRAS